jgi:hypothetical protein
MLAIARFSIPLGQGQTFAGQIELAKEALSTCPGFIDATIGQNLDEPTLWVLSTRWENVGSYRRALSSTRVKLEAIPLLAQAIDEPGAYE